MDQAIDYVTFLSKYMKLSSIVTYYQAVRFYHNLFGLAAPALSNPAIKLVINGIMNTPAGISVSKDPLDVPDLQKIFDFVCFDIDVHVLTWIAIVLMFRSLLRISHWVVSPHTLCREDLEMKKWGVVLRVRSSKTMKSSRGPVFLPLVKSDSLLCPLRWCKFLLINYPVPLDQRLLSTPKMKCFSYEMFSRVFKVLCKKAHLLGNYSSHSLRRGGTTLLANNGVHVDDIKLKGLWTSNAVNKYMVPSLEHRKRIDVKFAELLA